jgi:hypothetical protein
MSFLKEVEQACKDKFHELNDPCISYIKNRILNDIKDGKREFVYRYDDIFKVEQVSDIYDYFKYERLEVRFYRQYNDILGLEFEINLSYYLNRY